MPLQLGALRDALIEAGASSEKADKAAEELAAYESRFTSFDRQFTEVRGELGLHRWMLGFNIAMTIAILWRVFSHGG
jgi:hypothetical protein